MKKILLTAMLLLLVNCSAVFAEEELWSDNTIGLPKTYVEPEVQIMSSQDEFDERMREGWNNLAEVIDVSDLDINLSNYKEYYEKAKHNSPLYFYVGNSYSYSYTSKGTVTKIRPTYTETDKTVIENTLNEIEAAADEILFCIEDNMTDFAKVMAVHDYMVLNYKYDTTLANHSITIMTTKTGVCESYTYAFMYLMDKLGIEAKYVSSDAMNHAWNLVKIDGKWYHIDVTWDDPVNDQFTQVQHTYALLSSDKITHLDNPHYGYDLDGLEADSDIYDKLKWHESTTSIVSLYGMDYWITDDDLIREDGMVIYDNLSGGDGGWKLDSRYHVENASYAGLAVYNGKLYFNTDVSICAYNPHTEKTELVTEEIGVCGLYVEKNDLRYRKYSVSDEEFYDAGKVHLGNAKIGAPHIEDNKVKIKILHEQDCADDVMTFALGANHCQVEKATDRGMTEVTFDVEDTLTLFFWDSHMRPLKDKEVITIK